MQSQEIGTLLYLKRGRVYEYLDKTVKNDPNMLAKFNSIPGTTQFYRGDPAKTVIRVPYREIPRLMDLTGLTLIKTFQQSGVDIQKDPDIDKLIEWCKHYPDSFLNDLVDRINDGWLCKPWWLEATNPLQRIRAYLKYNYRYYDDFPYDLSDEHQIELQWAVKQVFRAVSLDSYPTAAKIYDLSLHWLLCFDDNDTIFLTEPRAALTRFYDHYKLLGKAERTIIDVMFEQAPKFAKE